MENTLWELIRVDFYTWMNKQCIHIEMGKSWGFNSLSVLPVVLLVVLLEVTEGHWQCVWVWFCTSKPKSVLKVLGSVPPLQNPTLYRPTIRLKGSVFIPACCRSKITHLLYWVWPRANNTILLGPTLFSDNPKLVLQFRRGWKDCGFDRPTVTKQL